MIKIYQINGQNYLVHNDTLYVEAAVCGETGFNPMVKSRKKKGRAPRVTNEMKDAMRREKDAGRTSGQVAEMFDLGLSTVNKYWPDL